MFKLQVKLAEKDEAGKPVEELLEDPHSEQLINISNVENIKCVFTSKV